MWKWLTDCGMKLNDNLRKLEVFSKWSFKKKFQFFRFDFPIHFVSNPCWWNIEKVKNDIIQNEWGKDEPVEYLCQFCTNFDQQWMWGHHKVIKSRRRINHEANEPSDFKISWSKLTVPKMGVWFAWFLWAMDFVQRNAKSWNVWAV